jgi:hypothetical protein
VAWTLEQSTTISTFLALRLIYNYLTADIWHCQDDQLFYIASVAFVVLLKWEFLSAHGPLYRIVDLAVTASLTYAFTTTHHSIKM